MNTLTTRRNVQAADAPRRPGALSLAWRQLGSLRALVSRFMCGTPLWAVATALSLAACKEAPPPRQFSTPDDYLTHPDPCVANTAKHIKASGRPWPNEEYPDPFNKGKVKIFDLWAGDRLYRIDSRRLNIFNYGGMKGEDNHPIQYRVMKETLVRLAGEQWVEQRGLPLGSDVFGTISCRNFDSQEDEIKWLNGLYVHGIPVRRLITSSPSFNKPVGVSEWHVASFDQEGRHVSNEYVYAFDKATTQVVYGKHVELLARCDGRLGDRKANSRRSPRCSMNMWLGPGAALSLLMEPPAPEYIGEVFNMIKDQLEKNRIK